MNRAERRRAKLKKEEPVLNVKASDLARMKQEEKEKATSLAVDTVMVLLLALPVKVMHDKYGWGMKKRLPEFAEALTDEYQVFADGDMTLEEYQQLVYDYCGIKFKRSEEE